MKSLGKIKKSGFISSLAVIAVMVVGILAAVWLMRGNLNQSNKATVSGGAGMVTLVPGSAVHYPGDTFTSAIKIRTGTAPAAPTAIASLALQIAYPYGGTVPELDIVNSTGAQASSITADPAFTSSGWTFSLNSVTRSAGMVTVKLLATYINPTNPAIGYSTTTDTTIATINFKANSVPVTNPIVLNFDLTQSKMQTKAAAGGTPVDILNSTINPGASYTVQNDTTAPAAVANLGGTSAASNSATLSWTAPSDTGPTGNASAYDLRYSTAAITAANFATATQVLNEPAPKAAGSAESFTVTGLAANTTYYFALKSADAAGNWSTISNVMSVTTTNPYSTLTLGFKLQGMAATAGLTDTVTLNLVNGTTLLPFSNITVTSDTTGTFITGSPISLGIVPGAGTTSYDVLVKDATHLRKKLGTMVINTGTNATPTAWNSSILQGGDFDNNNNIDIADISAILPVFVDLQIPVTTANQKFDVNRDGIIDITDVSIVLANYNALNNPGD